MANVKEANSTNGGSKTWAVTVLEVKSEHSFQSPETIPCDNESRPSGVGAHIDSENADGSSQQGADANGAPPRDPMNVSYWRRRMDLWDRDWEEDPAAGILPGSILTLPLTIQAAFRRKMLTIFALQLLLVVGITALLTYEPTAHEAMNKAFYNRWLVLVALVGLALSLVVLYKSKEYYPLNWIVLVAFSIVQSIFFTSVDIVIDSKVGVFACGFSFCAISVMNVLSGIKLKTPQGERLVSSISAGFGAFVIVGILACIGYAVWGQVFVTSRGLMCTLALQFVLMLWFSYDASSMYAIMSPDEYMNGIIYFYTDLVLIAILFTLIAAVSLIAQPNAGCFYSWHCNCGGCCGGGRRDVDNGQEQQQQQPDMEKGHMQR